jgi:hypothetical protein
MADLSVQELQEEIVTWAAHVYAGTCRWLELVGELDARGGWQAGGAGSSAEWLAWRCALSPRSAREHVRVARALRGLPLIHAGFARGELSYAKVRALTRVATEETEVELLELARSMTAAQLERAVAAYRRVSTEEANELFRRADVATFWEDDGSLSVHMSLDPEQGALFLRALVVAREELWVKKRDLGEAPGSAEPYAGYPSRAEGVAAMAEYTLAGLAPRGGADRYQLVVHVDEAALQGGDGACVLDDGPALAPETPGASPAMPPSSASVSRDLAVEALLQINRSARRRFRLEMRSKGIDGECRYRSDSSVAGD